MVLPAGGSRSQHPQAGAVAITSLKTELQSILLTRPLVPNPPFPARLQVVCQQKRFSFRQQKIIS